MEFGDQIQTNLWGKLLDMISGQNHENLYLRKIIGKMEEYYRR
jgi:hypothetical protein